MIFKRFAAFVLSLVLTAACSSKPPVAAALPKLDHATQPLNGTETVTLTATPLVPDRGELVQLKAKVPVVSDSALVSQTVDTGWDFPLGMSCAPTIPEG